MKAMALTLLCMHKHNYIIILISQSNYSISWACILTGETLSEATDCVLQSDFHLFKGGTDYNKTIVQMSVYWDPVNISCVNLSIVDDSEPESNETLLLLLTTADKAIMVNPQYAVVVIVDTDTEGTFFYERHERT